MPLKELEHAESQIHIMQSATNLDTYERAWKDFLSDIDTAWNLCKDAAKHNGHAQQIIGITNRDRKDDELVCYLMHARNSRTHSIRPITETIPGATVIRGGVNGGVILRGTVVGGDPAATTLMTRGNISVTFRPNRLEVIEVQDRGLSYPPPSSHQGKAVNTRVPHELGMIGLTYYRAAISSALRA